MKNKIIKYRSVLVVASSLVFNLVSSLLVWHPEGVKFNATPETVTEWICDIIGFVWFLFGFAMMFFDLNLDGKRKIKEAILECDEELKTDRDSVKGEYINGRNN